MRILFAVIVMIFISCNNAADNKAATPAADSAAPVALLKAIDLQPEMRGTDSVQALFYNDPDGDPKRYTRFFKVASTIDTGVVSPVLRSLDQSFQEYENVKDCRSEGKIYLFKKGVEDPLQTIYFSTRCDTCCYVYYIRNGRFYYMPMTTELDSTLKRIRQGAREPKPVK
jgi:hypothetical protein